MSSNGQEFVIGIAIYDGIDLLDVAAPREMFSWMAEQWTAQGAVKVVLVAERDCAVKTRDGTRILPDTTFDDVRYVDVMWVPGADPKALQAQMDNERFKAHLCAWAENAQYVASVCEGALILAAAGLLNGYSATTHWAFLDCLRAYPEINVIGSAGNLPRFVVDAGPGLEKNAIRVTGGGISSGLDEALEMIRLIAGEAVAMDVQQTTQYFPDPPVNAPLPEPTCVM